MIDTTVFTCANRGYEKYIPLFAHSILLHEPRAAVEVGIENDQWLMDNHKVIDEIQKMYPGRFSVRKVEFPKGYCPHSIRFINTPKMKNRYVYISDVDIVTLEPFVEEHLEHMNNLGAGYSNIVRRGTKRLTGLHFTEWDSYYPVTVPEKIHSDEEFLYSHVSSKEIIDHDAVYRPIHGLHLSPNQRPWKHSKWVERFESYLWNKETLTLVRYMSDETFDLLKEVIETNGI